MDAAVDDAPSRVADASEAAIDLELRAQLNAEVLAMLRHAFADGVQIPPSSMLSIVALQKAGADGLPAATLPALAALHAQLAKIVAPARPGTLRLLHAQVSQRGPIAMLGPLPNLRHLTIAAIVCTIAFVTLSLSPMVDASTMAGDLYTLSGLRQLVAMSFLLAAAGMGGAFQALFTAQGYACKATYDPVYDSSYWVRIGLGLVAGLMLAVLVPVDSHGSGPTLAKPLLAVLGGFSANLVHRILQRLVDMVGSLFDGDRRERQRRERDVSRGNERRAIAESRIDVASRLIGLRDQLARGVPPQRMNELLGATLDELLAGGDVRPAPTLRESHSE